MKHLLYRRHLLLTIVTYDRQNIFIVQANGPRRVIFKFVQQGCRRCLLHFHHLAGLHHLLLQKEEQKTTGILEYIYIYTGNTKGGSITVQLTSCLTGLESAV